MVRTVVLSGGVPPQAGTANADAAYAQARMQAVIGLGDPDTSDAFFARNPDLAKAPLAQVDLALAKGDATRACELSDTVTSDRGQTPWVRLRAACHALRGERAAAELTRDLLRNAGYDDPAYYAQMDAVITGRAPAMTTTGDALVQYLANRSAATVTAEPDGDAGPDADLAALFANFSDLDLAAVQSALGNLSLDVARGDLDRATALTTPTARATARLFVLGQAGDAEALDAFITRAQRAGVSETELLETLAPMTQALPAETRARTNLARYARAAVLADEIGTLQAFYAALPDGPLRGRIALAADAMGGGFTGRPLGRDIDGRLSNTATRDQALRDAQLALALGAQISDAASEVLPKATLPRATLSPGDQRLLSAAARDGAQAETALRAAALLSRSGSNATDRALIVDALQQAGLTQFSGQLAAQGFLDALIIPISSP